MQRRIEQANGYGQPVHGLVNAFKVTALHWQQFGQRLAAARFVMRQNHLAHSLDTVAFKEHVLSAAQPDTDGTKITRYLGIFRIISIGADFKLLVLVG